MKYNVTGVAKALVPQGKQNAGQAYAIVTIEDPEDGEERQVPVFDKEADRYLRLVPNAVPGQQAVPLPADAPENLKVWKNCFDKEFVFPEPMVRVDAEDKPIRNKKGDLVPRSSVIVMTRYKTDNETGELAIRRSWDLTTRGTSVMSAFYAPLSKFQHPTGPDSEAAQIADAAGANAQMPV